MVVGPHTRRATVRSVQLVTLQPSLVLALADPVERRGREVRPPPRGRHRRRHHRQRAGALLDTQLLGRARGPLCPTTRGQSTGPAADTLAREARDALAVRAASTTSPSPLYVGGASRLAAEQRGVPARATSAARLLELLEHQVEVVSLVRDLLDTGLTVRIGSENPIDELRDCSIVVAPYRVDGEVAGTVGVLGPTRMDYRQALAAVEAISAAARDGPLVLRVSQHD